MTYTTTEIAITTWESGIIDINVPQRQVTYRIKQGHGVFRVYTSWATKPTTLVTECASLEQAYSEVFRLIIE